MRLIIAPSNLGLRPLAPDHIPGTWRAPEALEAAGLLDAVQPEDIVRLPRPHYSDQAQPGTRLLNGPAMRRFNLDLADHVETCLAVDRFALVVGGDCSILLGALAGARRHEPLRLLHLDGHSDFRHPGNYDPHASLGAVAGMDLALATGRGEAMGTDWPGVPIPLVVDSDVVQVGEREGRDADFAWPDVRETGIRRIEVFEVIERGLEWTAAEVHLVLDGEAQRRFWVHFDVDVLDQSVMPAVDSPGSPGLDVTSVVEILAPLVADLRCLGMTVTVFDPDLDPDGRHATTLVDLLRQLPFRR